MAQEDQDLVSWFDQLRSMRTCMKNLNADTKDELAEFHRQKVADLLLTGDQKKNFQSCFFEKSQQTISEDDLKNATTFGDLLSRCYRSLSNAVLMLLRRVAIESGTATDGVTPADFAKQKTKDVYPTAEAVDTLCDRLADSMSGIFPEARAKQEDFRKKLAQADTTTGAASLSII